MMLNELRIKKIVSEVFENMNYGNRYKDLGSINDRIYDLLSGKMLSDEEIEKHTKRSEYGGEEFYFIDDNGNEFDSFDEYHNYIVEDAIDQVLNELKQQLMEDWGAF